MAPAVTPSTSPGGARISSCPRSPQSTVPNVGGVSSHSPDSCSSEPGLRMKSHSCFLSSPTSSESPGFGPSVLRMPLGVPTFPLTELRPQLFPWAHLLARLTQPAHMKGPPLHAGPVLAAANTLQAHHPSSPGVPVTLYPPFLPNSLNIQSCYCPVPLRKLSLPLSLPSAPWPRVLFPSVLMALLPCLCI